MRLSIALLTMFATALGPSCADACWLTNRLYGRPYVVGYAPVAVATPVATAVTQETYAAGYAPAVGFLHSGKPLSFVYDIADIFKFETVVPVAFQVAARKPSQPDREVRIACRDSFRQTRLLKRIIPTIEEILCAGGIASPPPPEDAQPPAPAPWHHGEADRRRRSGPWR